MVNGRVERILITGFPGFIGRRLIRRILETNSRAEFSLLVQESFAGQATTERSSLLAAFGLPEESMRIVTGDVTRQNLGLGGRALEEVLAETTRVYHLAALYDLAAKREPAERVNVLGTVNVLDLCERMQSPPRLIYFSTCYVSGDREDLVLEDELEKGQGFKNYYEETKYLAEAEVRRRQDRIPTVILRPAIVVGDSKTGETAKYDGPYFMMRFYLKKPNWLPPVLIGKMASPTNLVPVDYVVDATVALSNTAEAEGKTFQIADPKPLSTREFSDRMCDHLGIPRARFTVPEGLASALGRIQSLERWTGIPRQALPFLNHHAVYDTTRTRELLEPLGITCPSLPDYFDTLYRFLKQNPSTSPPSHPC